MGKEWAATHDLKLADTSRSKDVGSKRKSSDALIWNNVMRFPAYMFIDNVELELNWAEIIRNTRSVNMTTVLAVKWSHQEKVRLSKTKPWGILSFRRKRTGPEECRRNSLEVRNELRQIMLLKSSEVFQKPVRETAENKPLS